MTNLKLAFRLLVRDARAGELRLLLAALILAVAALTAVGFFTDRLRRALELETNQMLGADLLLIADHPWADEYPALAQRHNLQRAQTITFPSMVSHGEQVQLADIKAVSAGYPLRGRLRISMQPGAAERVAQGVPQAGEVWADERLAATLNLKVGDEIRVGQRTLRLAAFLMLEPDRGVNFFALAPRLMMQLDDVPSTALIQTGSRVNYRLLLAGDPDRIAAAKADIQDKLGRGERLEDNSNGRPEMRQTLERAQSFLGLSALLGVVLSAVAVALAARRYVERHLDSCALMRSMGLRQSRLLTIYAMQFAFLSLIGMLAGCVIGYAAHYILYELLAPLLNTPLPRPTLLPLLQGMAVALLLFVFALPPLMQLRHVPPLRVIRRDAVAKPVRLWRGYAGAALALAALMLWVAGELKLGLYVIGGFAAALLAFAGLAWLGLRILDRFRAGARGRLQQALASLARHRREAIIQTVALALGFMAMLLLSVIHQQLLDAWRKSTPPDAPNRFVINIQPDQLREVSAIFEQAGFEAPMAPMVRGRLASVNGKPVRAADYAEERAQRLVEREFNLSWRADLPKGNRVVGGQWFGAGAHEEASVEDGLAKTLNLKLGDRLRFEIAGSGVEMKITSLRKLDWDSMRVNFFVLAPPGVLENQPQSFITSFHLPQGQGAFVPQLVTRFPNLTVIDISTILRQLNEVIDQLSKALRFVFVFSVLCGVAVLYAAMVNGLDARRREQAVMRALGASRERLRQAMHVEFAMIGGLAGLIAGIGSLAVGQWLANRVFQFEMTPTWWLPVAASLAGALLLPYVALPALRSVMRVSPVEALRESV